MLSSGLKVIKRLLPFKTTCMLLQGLPSPSLLEARSISKLQYKPTESVGPGKEEIHSEGSAEPSCCVPQKQSVSMRLNFKSARTKDGSKTSSLIRECLEVLFWGTGFNTLARTPGRRCWHAARMALRSLESVTTPLKWSRNVRTAMAGSERRGSKV